MADRHPDCNAHHVTREALERIERKVEYSREAIDLACDDAEELDYQSAGEPLEDALLLIREALR